MNRNLSPFIFIFLFNTIAQNALGQGESAAETISMAPSDCGEMEVWDYGMAMCMPLPMPDMQMIMTMIHGNAFLAQTIEEGPRGRNAPVGPNMLMMDLGTSLGDRHYLNLDLMATAERWTFPTTGYPEPLQIGEHDINGAPYIDAQHPHSSPIMGLTLSDTIALGHGKDHLKIFLAPRGASTDGPVAFMHRPTGIMNPDAPLGHHIGQDVGHISSTVAGASLHIGSLTIEGSTFNGKEPQPTRVDLPLGSPDSYAARTIFQFTPSLYAMASAAFVKSPEVDDPTMDHLWRYSASIYANGVCPNGWTYHNALIYGLINDYDHVSALTSFAEEFWLHHDAKNFWGRLEVLQRSPSQLALSSLSDLNQGRWVEALTLGYTHEAASWSGATLGIGASITKTFVPSEFQVSYGTGPWSVKAFIQFSGMRMWQI